MIGQQQAKQSMIGQRGTDHCVARERPVRDLLARGLASLRLYGEIGESSLECTTTHP